MNVLFYQDTVAVSGAEKYIADAACKLREFGHNVSIACPNRSWMERQAQHKGFPYLDFSIEDGTDDHLHWALTDHLINHQVDVIFCGTPGKRPEVPRLDAAIKAAGRGRIIIRIGVSPGNERAFEPSRLGIGYDTVDGIVAVSEEVRKNLLQFYPQLDPKTVHCLYNGVDLARFAADRHSASDIQKMHRSIGIPDGHRVIAAIGRLDPIKNLPLLIESASTILETYPETTFVIAGEGAQRETLERFTEEHGLSDHVRFVGQIDDVPRLLSAIDVVCHPSLSEGVPNTLMEAMAAGKAIVASDIGGIPELVTHDLNGLLVPVGNGTALTEALLGLLAQPSEMKRLSEAARHHVATHFDRSGNIEQIEQLLLSCVRGAAFLPQVAGRSTYTPDDSFIASPTMVA